jgi:FtsP/CotA-like multicopper oxidase with cupredoxin domain
MAVGNSGISRNAGSGADRIRVLPGPLRADGEETVRRRVCLVALVAAWIAPSASFRAAVAQDGPRRVIEARIENREVVAPTEPIRVTEGDVVELRWTSDEAVELHLHGYDIELRVEQGEPAAMVIETRATGRFPITSHGWGGGGHGHDALTYLEVYPR